MRSLRELILAVRGAKTAAEERGVISREAASIRTAFRKEELGMRERNLAKLLYIHMLGYPSHWGQVECVKMMASPRFHEKRLGYLGLKLLLDEGNEVMTLAVNSMQRDLQSKNQYVAGLALTAVADVGSVEMVVDLKDDIERHLRGGSTYTRKKAALACIRLLSRAPQLYSELLPRIVGLMSSKNHAVILTGVTLLLACVRQFPQSRRRLARLTPALVRILGKLVKASYAAEYTVGHVVDPFLQVRIMQLLRELHEVEDSAAKAAAAKSEELDDMLTQVATTTNTSKNAGFAVLYECVRTILAIPADHGLRVLAINLLGRFLLHRDVNVKYVALRTLCTVVKTNLEAVQRHRGTILDLLKHPDVSLRKRALELTYSMADKENVHVTAGEMVNYLVVAGRDERPDVCSKIAGTAARFGPSRRWQVDVLLTTVAVAGDSVQPEILARLLMLISADEPSQASVTHKVYTMLVEAAESVAADLKGELVTVAAWCVGEFGEHLLQDPPPLPQQEAGGVPVGPRGERRTQQQVVDLLAGMLDHHGATRETRAVLLSALLKLTVRFSDVPTLLRIRELVGRYRHSLDVELQQRSVEYSLIAAGVGQGGGDADLFSAPAANAAAGGASAGQPVSASLRVELLDRMPTLDERAMAARHAGAGTGDLYATALLASSAADGAEGGEQAAGGTPGGEGLVEMKEEELGASEAAGGGDLLGIGELFGPGPAAGAAAPAAAGAGLGDLFGGGGEDHAAGPAGGGDTGLGDLFGGGGDDDEAGAALMAGTPAAAGPRLPIMHDAALGLTLTLELDASSSPAEATGKLVATTAPGNREVPSIAIQTAVPKYMKQTLQPATGSALSAANAFRVEQPVVLSNPQAGAKSMQLRVRLKLRAGGAAEATTVHAAQGWPEGW